MSDTQVIEIEDTSMVIRVECTADMFHAGKVVIKIGGMFYPDDIEAAISMLQLVISSIRRQQSKQEEYSKQLIAARTKEETQNEN